MTKAAFARGTDDLDRVLAYEMDGQPMLFATADHAEGRKAFSEKRNPQFRGCVSESRKHRLSQRPGGLLSAPEYPHWRAHRRGG